MIFKKHFHALLLMSIFMLKISSGAIHLIAHEDEPDANEDHCELCEFAFNQEGTDTYIPSFSYELQVPPHYFLEKENLYQSIDSNTIITGVLSCRPPPSVF